MCTITLPSDRVLKACVEYLDAYKKKKDEENARIIQAYMQPTFFDRLFKRTVTEEIAKQRANVSVIDDYTIFFYNGPSVVRDIKRMCEIPGVAEITLNEKTVATLNKFLVGK